jgi:hypothetical protein
MTQVHPIQSLQWETDENRLKSGDRFWFLTDICSEFSSFYPNSPTQQWFRVGALNLATENRLRQVLH